LALFFDAGWFSKRLAALNLQKEVSAREVEVLSALLHASPGEIANRCGISTPVAAQPLSAAAQIDHLQKRVAALEAHVASLEAALRSR
jgi:uncharacterized protein YceH (UPF0502 family)